MKQPNFYIHLVSALLVQLALAAQCSEVERADELPCVPELVPGSDPLPAEDYFAVASNFARGRDENYLCRVTQGEPLLYLELPRHDVRALCDSDRAEACYMPGIGRPYHIIYVSERGDSKWAARHELAHYLYCVGPGLCTERESHAAMERAGLPMSVSVDLKIR